MTISISDAMGEIRRGLKLFRSLERAEEIVELLANADQENFKLEQREAQLKANIQKRMDEYTAVEDKHNSRVQEQLEKLAELDLQETAQKAKLRIGREKSEKAAAAVLKSAQSDAEVAQNHTKELVRENESWVDKNRAMQAEYDGLVSAVNELKAKFA